MCKKRSWRQLYEPAAVDHDHADADLRAERDLLTEEVEFLRVVRNLPADFDKEGLALELVDVGQRLPQEVHMFRFHMIASMIAFCTWSRFSASS